MDYVDDKLVEGFRVEVAQQLADAATFAINARKNDGESDIDELRQAAQDALLELTTPLVGATLDAYKHSPLKEPDYPAIALLFRRLAIRAELYRLLEEVKRSNMSVLVRARTRGHEYAGRLLDIVTHEGVEAMWLKLPEVDEMGENYREDDEYVPVVAILDLQEIQEST